MVLPLTTLGVDTIPDGDIISVEEEIGDKGREVKRKRGEGKRGERKGVTDATEINLEILISVHNERGCLAERSWDPFVNF